MNFILLSALVLEKAPTRVSSLQNSLCPTFPGGSFYCLPT